MVDAQLVRPLTVAAATHAAGGVVRAVADIGHVEAGADRSEDHLEAGSADMPAGALAVGEEAAFIDAHWLTQLVELDAVDVAEAGIADVADRLPRIGGRRRRAARQAKEDLVDKGAVAAGMDARHHRRAGRDDGAAF